jgi:undecaprenyl pyrophosphate phosphatase UppP
MLEIIALIFLCKSNGNLAAKKGLKPLTWKIYTAVAWVVAELIGFIIGASMFDKTNILAMMGVAVFCAVGGYLFVRKTLENKPDNLDKEINQIGVDDLAPPKK